jgi:hypothetical protein
VRPYLAARAVVLRFVAAWLVDWSSRAAVRCGGGRTPAVRGPSVSGAGEGLYTLGWHAPCGRAGQHRVIYEINSCKAVDRGNKRSVVGSEIGSSWVRAQTVVGIFGLGSGEVRWVTAGGGGGPVGDKAVSGAYLGLCDV